MPTINIAKNVYVCLTQNEMKNFRKIDKITRDDKLSFCDKFFRQEEMFDSSRDVVDSGYRTYSINDIPAIDYNDRIEHDLIHNFAEQSPFIDYKTHNQDLIRMLKDNKVFDMDKIFSSADPYIIKKIEEGYEYTDIANICYSSIINGVARRSLANEGFKMLKKSYPIDYVVNLMEHSKLIRKKGTKKYTPGVLEFLEQFPNLRSSVVSKNSWGEEMFDVQGAELFPKILDSSPDEETALKVLKDCKISIPDGSLECSKRLTKVAMSILNKRGKYEPADADLIHFLKKYPSYWYSDDIVREIENGNTNKYIQENMPQFIR